MRLLVAWALLACACGADVIWRAPSLDAYAQARRPRFFVHPTLEKDGDDAKKPADARFHAAFVAELDRRVDQRVLTVHDRDVQIFHLQGRVERAGDVTTMEVAIGGPTGQVLEVVRARARGARLADTAAPLAGRVAAHLRWRLPLR